MENFVYYAAQKSPLQDCPENGEGFTCVEDLIHPLHPLIYDCAGE